MPEIILFQFQIHKFSPFEIVLENMGDTTISQQDSVACNIGSFPSIGGFQCILFRQIRGFRRNDP